MVVEAIEVLKPFKASNKRCTPIVMAPRAQWACVGHRTSMLQSLLPPSLPPQPGRSGWWLRLGAHSLLSPAVLISSPRNTEALHGRCLINHSSNGSGSSSLPCWATCVISHSCSLALIPWEPICPFIPTLQPASQVPDWSKPRLGKKGTTSRDVDTGDSRCAFLYGLFLSSSIAEISNVSWNPTHTAARPEDELGIWSWETMAIGSVLSLLIVCPE